MIKTPSLRADLRIELARNSREAATGGDRARSPIVSDVRRARVHRRGNAVPRNVKQHVVFLGGPGVRYEERPPPAALSPWVAVYWRVTTDVDFALRIPPDGCMDLIGGDVVGSFSKFGIVHLP